MRAFAERFARWGFAAEAMTPVYGLSEAALAVTFGAIGQPPTVGRFDGERLAREARAVEVAQGRELACLGAPLPGFDVRVVDDERRELPEARVGAIEVRGPSLMRGYLGDPELTAQALREGWLLTGDLGFLLRGALYLSGRAKEMIVLRGRKHAPEEVERAVETVEGVRPGCAVAASWLPAGGDGERLLLLVEAARRTARDRFSAIADACARRVLAATGLETESVVVLAAGSLPRTTSGKLCRGEALRRHLAGELRPPRRVNALTLARALARSGLAYARGR
jgi:acyl-CoA synthetase (AMP-forming)/AMP-acid ligase II